MRVEKRAPELNSTISAEAITRCRSPPRADASAWMAVAGVGALFLGRIDSAHGAAGLVPDSSPADLHVPQRAEAPEVPESGNRASYLDRLPPDVRKALLAGGRRQVLPAGSYLFRDGDPAAEM